MLNPWPATTGSQRLLHAHRLGFHQGWRFRLLSRGWRGSPECVRRRLTQIPQADWSWACADLYRHQKEAQVSTNQDRSLWDYFIYITKRIKRSWLESTCNKLTVVQYSGLKWNIYSVCTSLCFRSSHALTSDVSTEETARAAEFFLSDGVIVTGTSTGAQADPRELRGTNHRADGGEMKQLLKLLNLCSFRVTQKSCSRSLI